jgi:hemerythrin
MEWTENLSVGVPEIDEQHKELIRRVNVFVAALHKENSKEETLKVLDFLSSYVVTHFRNEEAIQVRYNYPKYAEHHKLHTDFIKTVGELRDGISKVGVTSISSSVIAMTLSNWLVNHIGIQDKEIGKFIVKAS